MHYECELAVVIGRSARNVPRAAAPEHIAATPSRTTTRSATTWRTGTADLRVKSRDGATVLGPWLVDAADIPDPGNLGCAPSSTAS